MVALQYRTIHLPEYFTVSDVIETLQDVGSNQIILESSNAYEKEGGYADENEGLDNQRSHASFTLEDITPETLPSVRNIVSDVMLDIPYYMSHHQPKMIAAVVKEANRIYQLWCIW